MPLQGSPEYDFRTRFNLTVAAVCRFHYIISIVSAGVAAGVRGGHPYPLAQAHGHHQPSPVAVCARSEPCRAPLVWLGWPWQQRAARDGMAQRCVALQRVRRPPMVRLPRHATHCCVPLTLRPCHATPSTAVSLSSCGGNQPSSTHVLGSCSQGARQQGVGPTLPARTDPTPHPPPCPCFRLQPLVIVTWWRARHLVAPAGHKFFANVALANALDLLWLEHCRWRSARSFHCSSYVRFRELPEALVRVYALGLGTGCHVVYDFMEALGSEDATLGASSTSIPSSSTRGGLVAVARHAAMLVFASHLPTLLITWCRPVRLGCVPGRDWG